MFKLKFDINNYTFGACWYKTIIYTIKRYQNTEAFMLFQNIEQGTEFARTLHEMNKIYMGGGLNFTAPYPPLYNKLKN